jgi:hypothetical protein
MRTMIFTNVYVRNLSTTVNPQQALLCNIPKQHQDVKAPCCGLRCNECTRNEILLKIKETPRKATVAYIFSSPGLNSISRCCL